MQRSTTLAILTTLAVATMAIGAGARARPRVSAVDRSDRHPARAEVRAAARSPGEGHAAPTQSGDEATEPRPAAPDAIDWGNPYDLMLHGIKPGRTRDMR